MSISITAEQKELKKIFYQDEQFVIPSYQRPYSWGEEQCSRLWEDIFSAFESNAKEGYFLGNIILAKNSSEKNIYEVIDGQQRLITLSLLLKVLFRFDVKNKYLRDAIWILDRRDEDIKTPRVKSKIFENSDGEKLKNFLEKDTVQIDADLKNNNKKLLSKFEINYSFFLNEVKRCKEIKDNQADKNFINKFSDYVLEMLFLLPIQTEDKDADSAREKALVIFETINNTGLNLSDVDIFKSQLYNSALNNRKEKEFIEKWTGLINKCYDLDVDVLHVFRIFSHVLRGRERNKDPEISLRVFFSTKGNHSLQKIGHEQIFLELDRIIEIITLVEDIKYALKPLHSSTEASKWLQLVFAYSNQFPIFATYVYLYKNMEDVIASEDKYQEFLVFLKDLVRYCYYKGATSTVKFEIFSAIAQISHGEKATFNFPKELEYDFNYPGRLKNALALLAFYIEEDTEPLENYFFDKIITSYDEDFNDNDGNRINDDKVFLDSIGNIVVLDLHLKKRTIEKKIDYYQKSSIRAIRELSEKLRNWSFNSYEKRSEALKEKLLNFFKGV